MSKANDSLGQCAPAGASYVIFPVVGERVYAVDYERLDGGSWLRAATIRTKVAYDEDANEGRLVIDRIVVREFPACAIREVSELGEAA